MPFRASFGFGRSVNPNIVGIQLTSGTQYIHGGAGSFNQTIVRAIVRCRADAPSPNTNAVMVGTTAFGTTGWGVLGVSYPGQPSATRGRVTAYVNVYSDTTLHVNTDGEFQNLRTYEVWLDTVAGRLRLFIDGYEVGIGTATATTTMGIASQIGINTRANALGTLPWGQMTIVEIQTSTTAPTRAEILLNAQSSPGRQVAGAQRLWLASDLGAAGASAGSTWVDKLAGTSLTIVGSPNLTSVPPAKAGIGTVEIYGDSIAAGRRASGTLDQGWRRKVALDVAAAGRFVAFCGANSFTESTTPLDFDAKHTAVGSQALGVNSGATPRLTTLATDVTVNGSVDCTTILAYGINDLSQRITIGAQSPVDAVNAFFADLDTACSLIRVSRPSAPIFIQDVLLAGTGGSGITINVQSAITTLNANLPSVISALNTTYGNVRLISVSPSVTPNQAAADNSAVLYDKIHETDASKEIHGAVVAAALLAT